MSWLKPVNHAHARAGTGNNEKRSLLQDFLDSMIVVERDLDSGHLISEEADGHTWLVAFASYELLEQVRGQGDDLDHATMRGRELREQIPREVGLIFRPNRDDEITVQWPKSAPVARIAVE